MINDNTNKPQDQCKEDDKKKPVKRFDIYDEYGEERYYDMDEDDSEDCQERYEEERFERLSQCTCGAWQVVNWELIHVADCCCGAE